ncbi:protein hinderin [Megalops cyprinoides]|uniref:protein hinderin n=1 Tax=Megalops cyprinoides TaxID=118141 RepID=UPI001863B78B|nr:protein hinderin [Megalops cyprinoides]
MADVSGGERTAGIYWIKDTSDEDQPMVFVPGVSRDGNLRPGAKVGLGCSNMRKGKMRAGHAGEVTGIVGAGFPSEGRVKQGIRPGSQSKASFPPFKVKAELHPTAAAVGTVMSSAPSPHQPTAFAINQQAPSPATQSRSSVSLKDLCPEDKRRIANLIQELARVSEEKDVTEQRLKDEQESFERKIQQLEEQNQLIVQERGSLQQQYRECQELLALYQQYLAQQQEKLNQSITQLNQSHSSYKVSDGPVRQWAGRGEMAGMDGSYLGLPTVGGAGAGLSGSYPVLATGAVMGLNGSSPRSPVMGGSGAGTQPGSGKAKGKSQGKHSRRERPQSATPTPSSSNSGQDSDLNEGGSQKRGSRAARSEPRPGCLSKRGGSGRGAPERRGTVERCCTCRSSAVENDREDEDSQGAEDAVSRRALAEERKGGGSTPAAHPASPADSGGRVAMATAPPNGQVDWEERRRWLLLQKMELEVQRERLQAQLAQQEERLIRQSQQLRQSRLDFSRFQEAAAELEAANGALCSGLGEHNQGTCGTVTRETVSVPPNGVEDLGRHTAQLGDGMLQHEEKMALPSHSREALAMSRKDAATSPVVSQTQVKPIPAPVLSQTLPRTPHARVDTSLIELLDVLSPISASGRSRLPARPRPARRPHSDLKPQRKPLSALPSPWGPQRSPSFCAPDDDTEESQILEDIFFIC